MPLSRWLTAPLSAAAAVVRAADWLRYGTRRRLRLWSGARIAPYRGFGTRERLLVLGRVLRNEPLPPTPARSDPMRSLRRTLGMFATSEIPDALVRLRTGAAQIDVRADSEGHFRAWLPVEHDLPHTLSWHGVGAELLDPVPRSGPAAPAEIPVLVPSDAASFAVISDIDDTVIRTGATNLLRMARNVLFSTARTRLPFEGVAAFYRALQRGPLSGSDNPLFYVSSGPWNLYELLVELFELRHIPAGPLLLRDWGVSHPDALPIRHASHKLAVIREIMDCYPQLDFVLVGDSGQEDPEIYARVVRDRAAQVRAVYIRDVVRERRRHEVLLSIAAEMITHGVEMVLSEDTIGAARHAAEHGLISPDTLPAIGAEAASDHEPE